MTEPPNTEALATVREAIERMDAGLETNSEAGTPDWFLAAYPALDAIASELERLRDDRDELVYFLRGLDDDARRLRSAINTVLSDMGLAEIEESA